MLPLNPFSDPYGYEGDGSAVNTTVQKALRYRSHP